MPTGYFSSFDDFHKRGNPVWGHPEILNNFPSKCCISVGHKFVFILHSQKKGVVNWRIRAPAKKPIIPQIKVEATDAKAVQGTNAHDQFDNSVRLSMFQKQEL